MATFIEITKLSHGHGGPGWELGTCLWCPAAARNDQDRYALIRELKPGDLIYHFVAGMPGHRLHERFLWGASRVAAPHKVVREEPPQSGDWGGRDAYYRVDLDHTKKMDPPFPMTGFTTEIRELLLEETRRRSKHYPFATYGEGFRTVQGTYLARPSPRLEEVILQRFPELN